MKNLYLLRHAKTELMSRSGSDFDRCLAEKGHQQLLKLAEFFASFSFSNSFECWVSTAQRTQETFKGIESSLKHSNQLREVAHKKSLYLADHRSMLNEIWDKTSENDLLIIGHNGGISELASYLSDETVLLATSEFVHIQFDCDSWMEISKGLGRIIRY